MRDGRAGVAHRHEQPMHHEFVAWCVHPCVSVQRGFLPNQAHELLVKLKVVRCQAGITYRCSGQVHSHARSTSRREALEDAVTGFRRANEDVNAVRKIPERAQV